MKRFKIFLLILLALGTLAFGLFGQNAPNAQFLQSFFGYYLCLAVVVSVVVSALQEWGPLKVDLLKLGRSRWLRILAVSALGTYGVLLHEPFMLRVYADEPGHLATARAMAEKRAVFSPQAGYEEAGGYSTARPSPIYRMYAYPFSVSVLHNLFGVRLAHGFIVNAAAAFLLLTATFLLGRFIGRCDTAGYCAQALLLTVPLLHQVANSAAYDLFNLTILAFFTLSCLYYSRQQAIVRGMNLCLSLGLLLAYSRNESILFLIVFVGIFCRKCWQARGIEVTWFAALSPVLLLGPLTGRALANYLSASFGEIYELRTQGFWGGGYIVDNFHDVLEWFLSTSSKDLNALMVSLLFLITAAIGSMLWMRNRLWLRLKTGCANNRRSNDGGPTRCPGLKAGWILCGFFFVIAAQNIMLLAMSWPPVDLAAIRFYLPTIWFMIIYIIWVLSMIDRLHPRLLQGRSFSLVGTAALLFFWVVTLPKAARAELTHENASAVYADQSLEWINLHDDGKTLYVTRYPSLFTLHEIPCIGFDHFHRNYDNINELVALDIYESVVVLAPEFYDPVIGGWRGPAPYMDLPDAIILESIKKSRKFVHGELLMQRVVGWQDTDGALTPLGHLPVVPESSSDWDFFNRLRSLRGITTKGFRE